MQTVPTMVVGELLLETGETVEMRTSDNRRVQMRASKQHGERPAIDLLPHVRYVLRARPSPPGALEAAAASLLLEAGVLLKPLDDEGKRVVALNLSEKIVRLVGGESLLASTVVAPAPHRGSGTQKPREEGEATWKKSVPKPVWIDVDVDEPF